MIGSFGGSATGSGIVKADAAIDVAAAAGGYVPNPKAMIADSEAELARRQRAMDRYYDRLAKRRSGGAVEVIGDGGGASKWILPAIIIGGVGIGAFFLFRRKRK